MEKTIFLESQEIFELYKIGCVEFDELSHGQKMLLKKIIANLVYLAKPVLLSDDRSAMIISVEQIPKLYSIYDLKKRQPNIFSIM